MDTPIKHNYKDSVFIDLFKRDEYRLQLFQTLHPEMTDITAADITTITLRQVITNHPYNDLALLVRTTLMIFVEAQSIWSINVLLRILLYYADTIQEYLHSRELDVYSTKKLSLPMPEFYVIYTGTRPVPPEISLKRDFFGSADAPIDLTAKVITAHTDDIIGQYIIFCHVLDEQVKRLGRTREAALEAIRICKNRGVLVEYLNIQEKEVVNIMMMLFNQEYATQQFGKSERREGRQEGRQEGREEGILLSLKKLVSEGHLTKKIAAAQVGMSEQEFDAMCAALK